MPAGGGEAPAIEELTIPPDVTLYEVVERLAVNSEMGSVSQLMQERQAMESDPERLAEVRQQIRALKLAEHPVMRLVYPEGPVEHKIAWRSWADVAEASKLALLQDAVDWSGVSNRDMAHMLLGELDVGKLSAGQRDLLIRLAEPEPARGKMSLEDLKRVANGHVKSREPSMER